MYTHLSGDLSDTKHPLYTHPTGDLHLQSSLEISGDGDLWRSLEIWRSLEMEISGDLWRPYNHPL